MIFINEWLPNPVGNDAQGEWVELWNNGQSAVNLGGWLLKTKSGDKFSLNGYKIEAGGYLVLARAQTKLVLRNTDEGLFLYDNGGRLVAESSFLGSAPEGKTYSRLASQGSGSGAAFVFSEPTLGKENVFAGVSNFINNEYRLNTPLNKEFGAAEFLGLMLGTAMVLTAVIFYAVKKNESLSKLFFGGDEKIR